VVTHGSNPEARLSTRPTLPQCHFSGNMAEPKKNMFQHKSEDWRRISFSWLPNVCRKASAHTHKWSVGFCLPVSLASLRIDFQCTKWQITAWLITACEWALEFRDISLVARRDFAKLLRQSGGVPLLGLFKWSSPLPQAMSLDVNKANNSACNLLI